MKILGLEFGSWSLKAVEMESRFRKLDVLDFHEVRLPLEMTDPTDTYRKAVKQLLARLPSHPDKVVTSLPPSQTALRFLQVPLKQRKKVEQTFRFELEDSVPFRLTESIVEHHVTIRKDGSVVFAAIAPEKHVQSHVEWLQSVGIDPDWLTFEGMGLVNLYLSGFDSKNPPMAPDAVEQGPVLLLDIGHHKTNVSIFDQNRLQLFRTIAWGGADLTQALSIALGCSVEQAERYKINSLKLEEDPQSTPAQNRELVTTTTQALSPFLADLNHSLVAFRTSFKQRVSLAFMTGGTSKIWGLDRFLSSSLGIPVHHFRSFSRFHLKQELETADEARFGEVIGRAVVFARKVPLLFNFRRQAAAKETSIEEIRQFVTGPNVLKLIRYSGILLLLLFIHIHVAGYLLQQEQTQQTQELGRVFQATFMDVPTQLRNSLTKNPVELRKFIDKKNNELKQKMKMISKERVPMLNLIRDISKSFPPTVKVDVNTLSLDDRTFSLDGVLYEGSISDVTRLLQESPSLKDVSLSQDGQRFTYKGSIIGR